MTNMGRRLITGVVLLCMSITVFGEPNTGIQLISAAKRQDWDVVRTLLNSHADVNTTSPDGATALAWASHWDNVELASLLIESGANPDLANDYGITPLILAIKNHSNAMVRILLEGGADANIEQWNGLTPLMDAAKSGDLELVNALLEQGADVNVQEPRRGQSALMWSISFGHPDIAKVLVEHGADVQASTHMLKDGKYNPMVLEGYAGNVSGTEKGGYTPLMFAARAGDMTSSRLLLSRGADINSASEEDSSALVIATAQGHQDLAMYLLKEGADPNIPDANGMTALHYALRDGIKVIHGYNIDFSTRVCGYALDTRCKSYNSISDEDRRLLEDPSLDTNLGLYIVQPKEDPSDVLYGNNMHELAEALLAAGANPDAKMKYPPARLRMSKLPYFNLSGATPFFLATAAADLDAMTLLLEYGVNPVAKTEINDAAFHKQTQTYADDNQYLGNATTLLVAAGLGRRDDFTPEEEQKALEAVKKLVSMGADVNEVTATGWTAVHAATFLGANDIVRFLAENGAKLNVKNGCGQSPVILALAINVKGMIERTVPHVSTAELLVKLGADDDSAIQPVGQCVLGRGALETDTFQNERVRKEIEAELKEIEDKNVREKIRGYL